MKSQVRIPYLLHYSVDFLLLASPLHECLTGTSPPPSATTFQVIRSTSSNTLPLPLPHPKIVWVILPAMPAIAHCGTSSLPQLRHRQRHQVRGEVLRAKKQSNSSTTRPVDPVPPFTSLVEVEDQIGLSYLRLERLFYDFTIPIPCDLFEHF